MTGPIRIMGTDGVHPERLDQSVKEQRLWNQGRFMELTPYNSTFVFGSNLAGIHGAGAARYAMDQLFAVYGVGFGPTGKCFAIPTKDWEIRSMHLEQIKHYVDRFIIYARDNPGEIFKVTQIGCGLADFKAQDIAPMFVDAPLNCFFDTAWEQYLGPKAKFWGTG